jgi:hypothetical protein
MTTVKFRNVGREKRSWIATLKEDAISEHLPDAIATEAGCALASRGVEVLFDPRDKEEDPLLWTGTIYVGGFRAVGTFEVIDPPTERGGSE